jgi:hypothetical protein
MANKKNILMGITNSFDSLASLILAQLQGYEVHAIYLDPGTQELPFSTCAKSSLQLLQSVTSDLKMPFYVTDISESFRENVIGQELTGRFLREYVSTCLNCHTLKCHIIYDKMLQLNLSHWGSGHRAKLSHSKTYATSSIIHDPHKKDDSVLLSLLPSEVLKRAVFPLESLRKEEAQLIVKNHLVKYEQELRSTKKSCDLIPQEDSAMEKYIAPDLIKKARLSIRASGQILSETMEHKNIQFGKILAIADGKGPHGQSEYIITGYNYSHQLVYLDSVDYIKPKEFLIQILHMQDLVSTALPMSVQVYINEEETLVSGVVYFKSLNYVKFILDVPRNYVPVKSVVTFFYASGKNLKLMMSGKIIAQKV